MKKTTAISVQGVVIGITENNKKSYISLTDIARYKNPHEPKDVVKNWLRSRNTVEFLWLREKINNPNFKGVEFDSFMLDVGTNTFTLSPQKWITQTHAIGLVSRAGSNGWTFAHKDIAIKFANRVSVEFELYLIKEFQRLKEQENKALDRDIKRFLTKMNYRIHTDAIKDNLIPKTLSQDEITHIYADEADVLNKALFGLTAKQRKDQYPNQKGNMRDFATIEQLIILANIESMNAKFIEMWFPQHQRLELLNQTAITQMKSLVQNLLPGCG